MEYDLVVSSPETRDHNLDATMNSTALHDKTHLNVLLVEDSADDVLLVELALKRAGFDPKVRQVETAKDFREALTMSGWDLILSDYYLPDFSGLEALKIVKESGVDVPFIMVSGLKGEEFVVEAMRLGARDYVPKFNLDRLAGAVLRAQKEAALEERIREAQKLYRGVGESLEYGVWVSDAEGTFTYLSESFLNLFSLTQEEFLARGWWSFLAPDECESVRADWEECLSKEVPIDREMVFVGSDGRSHPILRRGVPLRDRKGSLTGWAGMHLDISKIRKSEEELTLAKKQAELASQVKSQFLANMSHELRTPMNGIIGILELISFSELSSDQKKYLEIAQKSSDRLLEVIGDVLDFSKIEAGKMELSPRIFNLRQLLQEKIFLCKATIVGKSLELKLAIKESVPDVICCDDFRLGEILDDLLSNAVKFTDAGEVDVLVDSVVATGQTESLRIQVRDWHWNSRRQKGRNFLLILSD
jgi:PAS domain S-box-containing protein